MALHVHYRDDGILVRVHPFDKALVGHLTRAGGRWHDYAKGWKFPLARHTILDVLHPRLAIRHDDAPKVDDDVRAWLDDPALARPTLYAPGLLEQRALAVKPSPARIEAMAARLRQCLPEGRIPLPYQIAGVAFLEAAGGRALLADGMGLGKTVQALCLLALHPDWAPALVVCPASVRHNWVREARRWLPDPWTVATVEAGTDPLPEADLLVLTYDFVATTARTLEEQKTRPLTASQAAVRNMNWGVVVADEAHRIKNWQAARTKAVRRLGQRAPRFVALTGTPIVASPIDLHGALRTVAPDLIGNRHEFGVRYANGRPMQARGADFWLYDGVSNLGELRGLLDACVLRRVKADVLADLPPKRRVTLPVVLSARDYKALEAGATVEDSDPLRVAGRLWAALGRAKVDATADWLEDAAEAGTPALVFYHHREVGDALAARLRDAGVAFDRIDGGVPGAERQAIVDRFQGGLLSMLLLSITAAGEGLTLTRAADVVFAERAWTAKDEDQAEDRAHRIGQGSAVTCWRFRVERDDGRPTADTDADEMIEARRAMAERVLGDGSIEAVAETSLQLEIGRRVLARWRE